MASRVRSIVGSIRAAAATPPAALAAALRLFAFEPVQAAPGVGVEREAGPGGLGRQRVAQRQQRDV